MASIPTARLGRDGPPVSRLGLGLAALGRPGYMTVGHAADLGADRSVEALRRRTHQVLDAAWAGGVRYLDAARSYGRAEEFLADWIAARGIRPGELTIGSKWGYRYTADWRADAAVHEVKDHSLAHLTHQLAESRRLLGSHLKVYQIHSATAESGVLTDDAVLDALARLRDEGMRIGLSLSGPRQGETLERALGIERSGAPLFTVVQATWNLLEPSAGPALAAAHASGRGIIVKEALANGLLASGEGPGRVLAREAERLHATPDALALAAALAQPWAGCVLSGAVKPEQLQSNLAAGALTVPAATLSELETLAMPAEQYWARRAALSWT